MKIVRALSSLLIFLLLLGMANAQISLTNTDDFGYTYCNSTMTPRTCTRQQFVNPINVFENGKWVYYQNAKSLKGFWEVKVLKFDSNFPLQILDYNFTHIIVNISSAVIGGIPFQWCREVCLDAKNCTINTKIQQCNNVTILINSASLNKFQSLTIAIPDATQYKNLTWGTASTTIQFTNGNIFGDTMIGTNGGGILDITNYGGQTWMEVANSTVGSQRDYEGYWKFNTTVPSGVTINNAVLWLTVVKNELGSDMSQDLSTYHVYNSTIYSWVEGTGIADVAPYCGDYSADNSTGMTWVIKPSTSQMNTTKENTVKITNANTVGSGVGWNVTNMVTREDATNTAANRMNTSIRMAVTDITGDENYLTFCIMFNTSQAAAGKPYLNITYTEGGAQQYTRYAYDSFTFGDSNSRATILIRSSSDLLTFIDSTSRNTILIRSSSDSFTFTDSNSRTIAFVRSASDYLTFIDVNLINIRFTRVTSDFLMFIDLTKINGIYSRSISDYLTFIDTSAINGKYSRFISDYLVYADSASRIRAVPRSASDYFIYTDSSGRIIGRVRLAADFFTWIDSTNSSITVQGLSVGLVNNSVTFTCNASSSTGNLTNVTFYITLNNTWLANETTNLTGTSAYANFTKTLSQGRYLWNCEFCNNESCAFSQRNYTLDINITGPQLIQTTEDDLPSNILDFNLLLFLMAAILLGAGILTQDPLYVTAAGIFFVILGVSFYVNGISLTPIEVSKNQTYTQTSYGQPSNMLQLETYSPLAWKSIVTDGISLALFFFGAFLMGYPFYTYLQNRKGSGELE